MTKTTTLQKNKNLDPEVVMSNDNKVVNGIDREGKLFKGKGIILTNANADNSKVIKDNPVLDKEGRVDK